MVLIFFVETHNLSMLILSEIYYSGWQRSLNNKAVNMLTRTGLTGKPLNYKTQIFFRLESKHDSMFYPTF